MRQMMRMLAPGIAAALVAVPIRAQTVTYFTQGYFTSLYAPCNMTAPIPGAGQVGATCSGEGFSLQYLPTSATDIGNGSITSLGQFLLTGTGTVTVPSNAIDFNLIVNQTAPDGGSAIFVGAISGTVSTENGNVSSLIWTPNQFQSIGTTNYQVIFDNVGPAENIGLGIPIDNQRGINALVTTTPEPASLLLVGTGLTGLLGVVRRRRKSAQLV